MHILYFIAHNARGTDIISFRLLKRHNYKTPQSERTKFAQRNGRHKAEKEKEEITIHRALGTPSPSISSQSHESCSPQCQKRLHHETRHFRPLMVGLEVPINLGEFIQC